MGCPHDGTSDQVREEGDEGQVFYQLSCWCQLLPIDINGVTQRLKGVEANTGGKNQLDSDCINMPSKAGDTFTEAFRKEVEVLEETQNAEVTHNTTDEKELSPTRTSGTENQKASHVVNQAGRQHEKAEPDVPPAIKDVAGNQK